MDAVYAETEDRRIPILMIMTMKILNLFNLMPMLFWGQSRVCWEWKANSPVKQVTRNGKQHHCHFYKMYFKHRVTLVSYIQYIIYLVFTSVCLFLILRSCSRSNKPEND